MPRPWYTRIPANTRILPNVVLMLVQRRRRWANIITILVERLLFSDILLVSSYFLQENCSWLIIIIMSNSSLITDPQDKREQLIFANEDRPLVEYSSRPKGSLK